MQLRQLGLAVFSLGALLVHVYTTIQFLWHAFRIPLAYPLMPPEALARFLMGYSAPIGALLMLAGGLIYGLNRSKGKEVTK